MLFGISCLMYVKFLVHMQKEEDEVSITVAA